MSQGTTTAPAQEPKAHEPKPASISELKAAFADDPTFALEAAENAWTMDEAKKMHGMITSRTTKLADENKQLREKTANAPPARVLASGVKPIASKVLRDATAAAGGDLVADFNEAVEAQLTKSPEKGRKMAILSVAKRDPQLHRSYLEATNPKRKQRDMIADKYDGDVE